MKIYGHCRFSYFGVSDTGRSIGTPEAAFEKLWHPVRMAARFHLFEHITLPAIRSQTDPDFRLTLITTKMMPDLYHERLASLTEGLPQVQILRTEEQNLSKALRPVMKEASQDFTQPSVHFRLDDDDAVSTNYIERLRDASGRVEPGGMVTFPSGVLGFLNGERACHASVFRHSIAIGLAIVAHAVNPMQPFRMQHLRHFTRVPSYADPTFPAYHWTLHSVNTSSGFGQLFRTEGEGRRRIDLTLKANPELASGQNTTAAAESALSVAFPHTTGDVMRDVIRQSGNPVQLAEEMGFPLEPFVPA
jgi:hypothetical protein